MGARSVSACVADDRSASWWENDAVVRRLDRQIRSAVAAFPAPLVQPCELARAYHDTIVIGGIAHAGRSRVGEAVAGTSSPVIIIT